MEISGAMQAVDVDKRGLRFNVSLMIAERYNRYLIKTFTMVAKRYVSPLCIPNKKKRVLPLGVHKFSYTKTIFHFISGGFLYVDEILKMPKMRGHTVAEIQIVVDTNDKQRFHLEPHPENGRLRIRANQGHSMQVWTIYQGLQ